MLDHSGQIEKIDLRYTKKMIRPSKYYNVGADTLYGFTCRDERLEHSGDNTEYLFSKNKGIVIVRNAGVFFNRLDYYTDQLKQIERQWRWGK